MVLVEPPGKPPARPFEIPPWVQKGLAQRRPVGLDRYLVHLQLTTDAFLGGVLLTVGLLGQSRDDKDG